MNTSNPPEQTPIPEVTEAARADWSLQQQIAAINVSQAEINAANLRDIERQKQLLDHQRQELESLLAAVQRKLAEAAKIKTPATSGEARMSGADPRLQELLACRLECEFFPECLRTPNFGEWRTKLLASADPSGGLLQATLHLLTAALAAGETEEICRALAYAGRQLYRTTPSELVDGIAQALNNSSNNRYSLRVAHVGEPTEKSWMSFSGIASVNHVHSWAVFGPDRLKRSAAEVT
jgi:hypothetical protein